MFTPVHTYGLLHVSWSRRPRGAEAIPRILSSPALRVRGQRKAVGIPSGVGGNPKYSVGYHTGTIHEAAPPWGRNKPTNLTQIPCFEFETVGATGGPPAPLLGAGWQLPAVKRLKCGGCGAAHTATRLPGQLQL